MTTPFQRLKERKLVQWALAYLAGAWVLVEATGHVVNQFQWPPIIGQVVTIIAFFGFFVVLVIAWYHGEKGRQWVSGPELLIIALLLLISGGVLSTLGRPDEPLEPSETTGPMESVDDDRPRLAVLPCDNLSGDPTDEYLASALHDEILLKLQGISSLFSMGRASVEWYRENPAPLTQVAQELGVGFVGECSVQKYADQIRLIFQLLDGRTGGQVWAEDYDRELTSENLFDIQTDIAQQVAQTVGAVLTPEEQDRIGTTPTNNTEAYQHYLRGREALRRRTSGDIQAAFRAFQAALEEDDRFAEAHAGMADAWIHRGWSEADTAYFRRGRGAAERAIAMDSLLAEAHVSKAYTLFLGEWDWEGAERSFQAAIRLDPNNSQVHQWYGEYLSAIGRFDAGVQESSVALEMDPLAPAVVCDHGSALEFLGRTQEAISFFERCLELAPTWWVPYANLILAYPLVDREADALGVLERTLHLFGSSDDLASWEGLSGTDDFQAVLSRTLAFLEDVGGSGSLFLRRSFFLASLHVLAGQPDEAFEYLEAAVDERNPAFVKRGMGGPIFAPIRDDPRFLVLLRRMGLEG
jgi:serine/threonine-protein kinase